MDVESSVEAVVLRSTAAHELTEAHAVQSLWGGYGQILRCHLAGAAVPSVIVKHCLLYTSDAADE